MRLRVLGTLELLAAGPAGGFTTVVPLRSPKLRRLLAALTVHGGSVVSADRLADVLWGEQPPANADGALHNLVSRLRAVLGPDDGLAVAGACVRGVRRRGVRPGRGEPARGAAGHGG